MEFPTVEYRTELAPHLSPDEPVIQIDSEVPLELIPVEGEIMHPYKRPLAASSSNIPEDLPGWEETRAMTLTTKPLKAHLGTWTWNDTED